MISTKPFFIFFGETHGFLDDISQLKLLIDKFSPDIVLSEQMQNIELRSKSDFESFLKEKKSFSRLVSFKDVEPLVVLCYEKNIPLLGIDLPDFGYSDSIINAILTQSDSFDESELEQAIQRRTQHHLAKLSEFKNKPLTILVVIGAWHLRKDSLIRKTFNNAKYFLPLNNKNEEVFEPNGSELHFGEINNETNSSS